MTDIVERLHSKSPYLTGSSAERAMDEAADEIKRLRAAVPAEIAKGTYALAQEIIRLGAALRGVQESTDLDDAQGIARRALEPKT